MRFATAVLLAVISATSVHAQSLQDRERLFTDAMKAPGTLDSFAQEIGMKVAGAKACKADHLLDRADIDYLLTLLRRADEQAVNTAFMKAGLITNSLPLRPGDAGCKVVEEKIIEGTKLYRTIVSTIRGD